MKADSGRPWAVTDEPNGFSVLGPAGAVTVRLTTQGHPDGHASLMSKAAGAEPVEIFSGPAAEAAAKMAHLRRQVLPRFPAHVVVPAAGVVVLLFAGIAAFYAFSSSPERPRDGAYEKLIEQMADLHKPGTPPPMPTLPSQRQPVQSAPWPPVAYAPIASAAASPVEAVQPVQQQPPPASVPVPKDLPPIVAALPAATPAATDAAQVPAQASSIGPTAETKPDAKTDAKTDAKPDAAPDAKTDKPMTPSQAQELLETLEKVKSAVSDGNDIPPELLKKLPYDVAKRLVSTGVGTISPDDRRGQAQRLARVVRLPPEVMTAHRSTNGIADITDSNPWAANGGRISIPLPGGGDIMSPDVLKEFGLSP